ncbi:hypothetical protein PLICRDRAFT_28801 [Plicaturopsis crispa FD-325 SS-3]|nr:hypothetical protein PLICRDRAFT_28801 [Plicaturopsis crispa FD-325 SS-3]
MSHVVTPTTNVSLPSHGDDVHSPSQYYLAIVKIDQELAAIRQTVERPDGNPASETLIEMFNALENRIRDLDLSHAFGEVFRTFSSELKQTAPQYIPWSQNCHPLDSQRVSGVDIDMASDTLNLFRSNRLDSAFLSRWPTLVSSCLDNVRDAAIELIHGIIEDLFKYYPGYCAYIKNTVAEWAYEIMKGAASHMADALEVLTHDLYGTTEYLNKLAEEKEAALYSRRSHAQGHDHDAKDFIPLRHRAAIRAMAESEAIFELSMMSIDSYVSSATVVLFVRRLPKGLAHSLITGFRLTMREGQEFSAKHFISDSGREKIAVLLERKDVLQRKRMGLLTHTCDTD